MPDTPQSREYLHFQWTMPGGVEGGPPEPLLFDIVVAEMLLKDASPFVEGLQGVIDNRNLAILRQAVQNLLSDQKHGPTQEHAVVFTSAKTTNPLYLQSGAMVLFRLLEKPWPGKTISLIPVLYSLFEKIQTVATREGFWPTPPPSLN